MERRFEGIEHRFDYVVMNKQENVTLSVALQNCFGDKTDVEDSVVGKTHLPSQASGQERSEVSR